MSFNTFHLNWMFFYCGKCHSRKIVIRSHRALCFTSFHTCMFREIEHFDNVLCVSTNENILFLCKVYAILVFKF